MSASPEPFPDPAAASALHRRLLDGDPTASYDFAAAYLGPLTSWLREHNRRLDSDFCEQAGGDAVVALIRTPPSYRPELGSLQAYLCMSARGDLKNLLRRETKHRTHRTPWESVEHSPEGGKYLSRDDDPSLPLQIAEEQEQAKAALPPSVQDGLNEIEARVLELMLQGERRTSIYAAAMGITDRPADEQRREVKRMKDRLKARLKRAGGSK